MIASLLRVGNFCAFVWNIPRINEADVPEKRFPPRSVEHSLRRIHISCSDTSYATGAALHSSASQDRSKTVMLFSACPMREALRKCIEYCFPYLEQVSFVEPLSCFHSFLDACVVAHVPACMAFYLPVCVFQHMESCFLCLYNNGMLLGDSRQSAHRKSRLETTKI